MIEYEADRPGFYRDGMTWTEHEMPDKQAALNFLGAMNEIRYEVSPFNEALVKLMMHCDVWNRRALRRALVGQQGVISACILYKESDSGFRRLFEIAELPVPEYLKND